MNTLKKLKKFLKTLTLDDNLKFGKLEGDKLFATLDNGEKVYWLINGDLTLKSNWYYKV